MTTETTETTGTTESTAPAKPTRKISYMIYADPGHAWVKVPHKDLATLGIAGQISTYSYQRGEFAYLEEDADGSRFLAAAHKAGWSVAFRERHGNKQSRIRNYDTYKAPASPPASAEVKDRIANVWTQAERVAGEGYIVGVVPKTGKLIVAIDGNLNRPTFMACFAEAEAKGLDHASMLAYCDIATYTGQGIEVLKYADEVLP